MVWIRPHVERHVPVCATDLEFNLIDHAFACAWTLRTGLHPANADERDLFPHSFARLRPHPPPAVPAPHDFRLTAGPLPGPYFSPPDVPPNPPRAPPTAP